MRSKRAAQRARGAHQRQLERAKASDKERSEQEQTLAAHPEVIAGSADQGSAPWMEATPTSVIAPAQAGQPSSGTPVGSGDDPTAS